MNLKTFRARIAAAAFLWTLALLMPWAQAQTPDEVLIVGQVAEPKSLDPHAVTTLNDFRILMNIYDGLVRYRPGTLEVGSALAESWEISDDGLNYTFKLRQGVRFHDGSPFTAEAVKFNFERMLKEDHPYHHTGPFPLAFFFGAVEEINAIDEFTVEMKLREPYAPLLSNLAYPTGLMVSPEQVKKHGKDFGRHPSGTGPFRFIEWESNRRVVVEKNPHYWDGQARLQAIVFRPITDANTRVAEMMAGGIDLMIEVPPDNLIQFRRSDDYKVYEQAGPHLWFLILNAREKPFNDRRMRQAANYAIDKQALVDNVLQGTATVAAGPIPRAFDWAYNDELQPYPHDPEKARELIEAAGYGDGVEVIFYVAEGGSGMLEPISMGTAIQADLAKVGIDARIETYEWNTYLSKVNPGLEGKAHLAEMTWMTNDPDTLPFLTLRSDSFPDKGGFNSGYYANPRVDELLNRARTATEQAERAKLYKEMQEIVHEDAPWVFVASWKQNAVSTARVKGFELEPSFFMLLKAVYKGD